MSETSTSLTESTPKETPLSLLSPVNSDVLKEFVHRVADQICGRKGPLEEKFSSLCGWTPSQHREAVCEVEALLVSCVVHSYDREKLEEILPLNENQISAIMNCVMVRGDELQQSLLSQHQSSLTEALCDHDWKLKWVMGSSSLSSLREMLLELDLTTVKRTSSPLLKIEKPHHGRIRIELTRDNVSSIINVLEDAQKFS